MCERLLSVTGNKSETFVVVNGVGGGLGHKYRSTGLEVTYALIARKRLYCCESVMGVISSLNASWHSQCHRHLL